MRRPIPAGDYVEHFDPELAHHRASLLAVLEHLVAYEPQASARPVWKADLVNGATLGGIARFCRYSRRNFARRWMVEGESTGWAVLAPQ